MSNFGFLKEQTEYAMFASAAIEAEKVYRTSSAMCAIGCRKALELAVKWVYAADNTITMPYSDNLQSLIHEPSFRFALDRNTWGKLPYIVKLGNLAVHTERSVRPEDVILSLSGLFEFIQWVDYCYGANYVERKFDENAIPKERVIVDTAKIKEQESLISMQEATIKEMEAKLAAMADELTRAKTAHTNERSFNPESISEFKTRKLYIDLDMKLFGWVFKGDGQNVSEEFEVGDMNAIFGQKGFVDYVLWGQNGLPLAVVEAKKTSKDPNDGKKQAVLYADCLERRFKRRPFIFYTNGFETYFWNDLEAPPRVVSSIFSPEDLEKLMNRRGSAKDPGTIAVNTDIAGRYYQLEAIRAVCDNLRKGFRKNLLVMATGTGKTRSAAALTDVFSKSGQVKNILFLADRTGLVKQARDAFKEYLPQMSLCNLCENKKDVAARVVFSTYPTILNAIDEVKAKDGNRMFSPAHFDLIIIDEAHRSIFKKYRVIFEYFDALLVGLTATPKTEVDHNTYEFFEVEDNVPTFAYEYEQAIKDGYLVPYYNYEVKTKFISEGITYDELSAEDKARYEEDFTEDGIMPDYIAESRIDKNVFNQTTVDMVIQDLMERGIKVNGGDRLGKSIIFAENKRHAQYIVERFDKLYPQYRGAFAQRVVCDDSYAQTVIDDFKVADKNPVIAVSVDMMDTGIDVPEAVNLVFFKKVRSRVKFWQMIGRGTRLCANLRLQDDKNGEYEGKQYFLIFDYGGNFEFFRQHTEDFAGNEAKSLTENIFDKRIHIIAALQQGKYMTEAHRALRTELCDTCLLQINALNEERVAVRSKRKYVAKYKIPEAFYDLSTQDVADICKNLASLVHMDDKDEYAKRFDNLIYGLMLAHINEEEGFGRLKDDVMQLAEALLNKGNIPQVHEKLDAIKFVLNDIYWAAEDILLFEQTRKDLRDLIQFLVGRGKGSQPIITVLTDPVLEKTGGEPVPTGQNFENYRKKVNRFIEENPNDLAIYKLKTNKPLTEAELAALQETFLHKLGTKEDYKKEFGDTPLGILIRTIAGMDEEAIRAEFANFINDQQLNQQQIVFLDKIVDHIKLNGYVETPAVLTKPPFDNPLSIFMLFEQPQILELISIVDRFKVNAAV